MCFVLQHAVTFAAGLATEGIVPFAAIYSSFLQRGYDQIVHDVCLQSLPGILLLLCTYLQRLYVLDGCLIMILHRDMVHLPSAIAREICCPVSKFTRSIFLTCSSENPSVALEDALEPD